MNKLILKALCIILLMHVSCQEDEVTVQNSSQTVVLNLDQTVDLKRVFIDPDTGFKIHKSIFDKLFMKGEFRTVRFLLEVHNQKLQIRLAGVTEDGTVIKGDRVLPSSVKETSDFQGSNGFLKSGVLTDIPDYVSPHVLTESDANIYLTKWENAFATTNLINQVSYGGDRIRYFSMPKKVVKHMSTTADAFVYLCWGLNAENKLATVFRTDNDRFYDFSQPCPPLCDPVGD